jgi:hypothetical protein
MRNIWEIYDKNWNKYALIYGKLYMEKVNPSKL